MANSNNVKSISMSHDALYTYISVLSFKPLLSICAVVGNSSLSSLDRFELNETIDIFHDKDYNYNQSWKLIDVVLFSGNSQIASSLTSKYVTIVYQFTPFINIFISSNHGINFTSILGSCIIGNNGNVALSGSGQYQTIVYNDNSTVVYVSSDFGITFNSIVNNISGSQYCLQISTSGKYQAISTDISLYVSSDYGLTWLELQILKFLPIAICGSLVWFVEMVASELTSYDINTGITTNISHAFGFIENLHSLTVSTDSLYITLSYFDNTHNNLAVSSDYGANFRIVNTSEISYYSTTLNGKNHFYVSNNQIYYSFEDTYYKNI